MSNKNIFTVAVGFFGGIITTFYGGWCTGLTTLVTFMVIDYLSGLPMPGRPFYILINEPLSDILNVLNKNGLWHGPVISAKAGTEYLL